MRMTAAMPPRPRWPGPTTSTLPTLEFFGLANRSSFAVLIAMMDESIVKKAPEVRMELFTGPLIGGAWCVMIASAQETLAQEVEDEDRGRKVMTDKTTRLLGEAY